jgi:hypothetical protein
MIEMMVSKTAKPSAMPKIEANETSLLKWLPRAE